MSSVTFSPALARLCRLFTEEEAACRSLLDTVQEERAAIRTLAITEFHAINCRRLAILESLQALADERHRLVQELGSSYGLAPGTMSVHQLLDRLKGSGADELHAGYSAFIATARQVREEIRQNVVLIEGIRGVVDQALSANSVVVPGRDLYTHDGQSSAVPHRHVLIHQQG